MKTLSTLFLVLFLLFSGRAGAEEASVGIAMGANHAPGNYVYVAYDWMIPEDFNPGGLFFLQPRMGMYTQPDVFVATLGLGGHYQFFGPLYVRGIAGVSGQSRTTDRLGGHFQFLLTAGTGIQMDRLRIGPVYAHYSSAGIYEPNHGEDFIGVELGYSF